MLGSTKKRCSTYTYGDFRRPPHLAIAICDLNFLNLPHFTIKNEIVTAGSIFNCTEFGIIKTRILRGFTFKNQKQIPPDKSSCRVDRPDDSIHISCRQVQPPGRAALAGDSGIFSEGMVDSATTNDRISILPNIPYFNSAPAIESSIAYPEKQEAYSCLCEKFYQKSTRAARPGGCTIFASHIQGVVQPDDSTKYTATRYSRPAGRLRIQEYSLT